jgi:cytochrome c oxidase subunit 1
LTRPYGLAAWLLTKDHKRIAMLYLISITIFFAIGGLFALGIRPGADHAEGAIC